MAALTFDDRSGRFRDSSGRYVSERAVRSVIDSIADGASARLAAASDRLLAGTLSLAEWQAESMRTIKLSQVASATIAHGGVARMTPSTYGAAGRAIRDQYDYLRSFAAQIASGEQPLNRTVVSRAAQYGQAARVAFEREYGRDQRQRGYQFCRNVLAPAEHCAQCREQSARGWVPLGALVPIGQRTCRAQCRCRLTYSREAAGVAA
jgi:hypothetical protein